MSGIFPDGGVTKNNAVNSIQRPLLAEDCTALYHAPRCQPRFDPSSANAVISEILNVMKCADIEYDCARLDNLCRAIEHHGIRGEAALDIGGNTPIAIPNGVTVLGSGTLDIPNTYHETIRGVMAVEFTVQVAQLPPGFDTKLDLTLEVSVDPTYADNHTTLFQSFRQFPESTGRNLLTLSASRTYNPKILAGGRRFYWRLTSDAQTGGGWELPYSTVVGSVSFYGINCTTFDSFGTDND